MSLMRQFIREAFVVKKKELGEVKFNTSALSDPHIQSILKDVSQSTGVPEAEITKGITDEMKKIEDLKQYSKKLYETIAKNEIESQAFKLISKSKKLSGRVKFDPTLFTQLLRRIKVEHKGQFFPLRNPHDDRAIYDVTPILVPDEDNPEYKKYNKIDTAAATGDGHFIFNTHFMQNLLDYAHAKGVHGKGKKYKSNGGDIPDEYAYLEFLILHELLHYSYGDFKQMKHYPQFSHKVHNWAEDFRSNYMLVKSGYVQLPMGLFSDHINYDRQGSMYEMLKTVQEELDKLPKQEREYVEGKLDDLTDEHEPADGDPQPGQEPDPRSNPDKVHERIEGKLDKKKEVESEKAEGEGASDDKEKKAGQPGTEKGGGTRWNYSDAKPRYNWKQLLNMFIRQSSGQTEETYTKVARRGLTGIVIAAQRGAGAIKPGEHEIEDKRIKLAFCIDSSGSMSYHVKQALVDVKKFIQQHHGSLDRSFILMKFSGQGETETYSINLGTKQYVKAPLGKVAKGAKPEKGNMEQVFTSSLGGGTVFDQCVPELQHMMNDGYNVILMSDSDILWDPNIKAVAKLYNENKRQMFFIGDSAQTFKEVCKALKTIPGTFSHY